MNSLLRSSDWLIQPDATDGTPGWLGKIAIDAPRIWICTKHDLTPTNDGWVELNVVPPTPPANPTRQPHPPTPPANPTRQPHPPTPHANPTRQPHPPTPHAEPDPVP